MIGLLRKLFNFCEKGLIYLAIGSSFIMMCLTTSDALGRYLFNFPILVAYEVTEKYLMPMTFALALSLAYRGGTFIRVTFLANRLPKQVKLIVNYFVQIISILYAVAFIVTTSQRSIQEMTSGTTLGSVALPLWPAYWIIPVSAFFMTWLMLSDLRQVKSGKSHLLKEEEKPVLT